MQIALWSNELTGTGTSTLTGVLATTIAASHTYKTFVTHCLTGDLSLEAYLLKPSERQLCNTIGESNTEGLFRLIKNGKLTKDTVKDYCYSLLAHSNLDFLNTRMGYEIDETFILNYTYLLYMARQFYDVCLIDLEISIENPLFYKVLKETDILVVVCSQNTYRMRQIQTIIETNREKIEAFGTKIIFVMNQYDLDSTSIKRREVGMPIQSVIPYSTEIMDSCNRGELVDFLLRRCYSLRKNSMTGFMQRIQSLIAEILKQYEEERKHVV
jgi:MinD-like ATPase involved in chromosome partitioning or flagellar assembly